MSLVKNQKIDEVSDADLTICKKWFARYIKKYEKSDGLSSEQKSNLQLKRIHTAKVRDWSRKISIQEGFSKGQTNFAELIALFHDIGRFEQVYKYNTFSDSKSMDHGSFGIDVLKKYNIFSSIIKINESTQQIIYKAINYHNKMNLPEDEPELEMVYIKLLRDADKLDIYRVLLDFYEHDDGKTNQSIVLNLDPSKTKYTPRVLEKVLHGKLIHKNELVYVNDFKLLGLAWVYDFNFQSTKQIVISEKIIDKIAEYLPKNHLIDDLITKLKNDLRQNKNY